MGGMKESVKARYGAAGHGGLSSSWRSKEEMTLKDKLNKDLGVGVTHHFSFADKVSLLSRNFSQALDLSIDSCGDSCYNVGAPYSRESGVATASPPYKEKFHQENR